jgi:branched-chain amino acid transport system substrate-binding protein
MNRRTLTTLLAALPLAALIAGCGSSAAGTSSAGGTGGSIDIGVASTLSGAFGAYGNAGLDGIKLAVSQLNARGGLLGKQIKIVTGDDQIDPATGETVTRNLILNDHVVALFGSVSSASLTQGNDRTYAFEFSPNTDMEPAAAALAFAREIGHGPARIATITPNYSFGLDTVKAFLADLKTDGVSYTVTNQQTPALGATSYTSNLAAIMSSNPQYVFVGEYGADLITLTKQGIGLGLFGKAKVGAMYDFDVLNALGGQAPTGAIAWDRAPFWTVNTPAMHQFVSQFKAAYGGYPNEFAIIGYTAVQGWAYAVKHANSFATDKVTAALAGATVPTIRGNVVIRSCDHQAEVPEDTGAVESTVNSHYGLRLWDKVLRAEPTQIIEPCA